MECQGGFAKECSRRVFKEKGQVVLEEKFKVEYLVPK